MRKLIFLVVLSFFLICCVANKTSSKRANDFVNIRGRILAKGSYPHVYFVIQTKEKENYKIVEPTQEIKDLQRKTISVKAIITQESKSIFLPTEIEVLEILDF